LVKKKVAVNMAAVENVNQKSFEESKTPNLEVRYD
jgi:hypothetical protein